MALWPFGKKNKDTERVGTASNFGGSTSTGTPEDTGEVNNWDNESLLDLKPDAPLGSSATERTAEWNIPQETNSGGAHQRGGDTGPFDGDTVEITDFDFSDFSVGILNLGSIQLPLPKNSQVQVEMGEQGPRMLHVITEYGRITPVAFASPNSGGMWEESSREIADGMSSEGMPVTFETGPWGREVVGQGDNGIIRIIGVEGARWLYRVTLAAPHGKEDELRDLAREIIARSFIYRGTSPVLAGNSLPVELPAALATQIQQAMERQGQQPGQRGDTQ